MRGRSIPVRVRETGEVFGSMRAAIIACGYKPTSFIRQVRAGRPLPGPLHLDPIAPDSADARSAYTPPRRGRKPRPVINLTTGEVYASEREAAAMLYVSRAAIRGAIWSHKRLHGCEWGYLPGWRP